jgi:Flp pilus assembly protein TadG
MTRAYLALLFRRAARRFGSDPSGNIAITFALALIPILTFVGAAVDYSRANAARSSMQAALDAAALMLSRDLVQGTITQTDIPTRAQSYFTALYTSADAQNVAVNAAYTAPSGSATATIVLTATGTVKSDFMQIVGIPTMPLDTKSTTTWGNTRMRVAMVLDNTGSMAQNGKMSALQSAAKNMIDTLSTYNKNPGDVYISIIPFTKDVNAGTINGTSNLNAPWINWTEWEAEPAILVGNKSSNFNSAKAGSNCPFSNSNQGFTCTNGPATMGGQGTSTIPSTGPYAGYICPGLDSGNKLPGKSGIYYNGCYTTVTGSSASCGTNTSCTCTGTGSSTICHLWRGDGTAATAAAAPAHSTWTGCINDRDQNYDTLNTDPGSSVGTNVTPSKQFYAEQWSSCLSATVTPMSNDWTALKNQISAMTAAGNTNQSIGMAWGWQSLSTSNGPITAPAKDSNYIYKDYIVLLSDGLNTQNRWSTTEATIDARQELLCKNVKGDTSHPVTVFTIQVNINNKDPKSQVLQDCASTGDFQMITSASQTADAFQNVLTEISKLRVSK